MEKDKVITLTTGLPFMFDKLLTEELCDFTLTYNFQQIRSHKVFLCRASSYFLELFKNEPELTTHELPMNPKGIFQLVLDSSYSGQLYDIISTPNSRQIGPLNEDNIIPFYTCVDFYKFDRLLPIVKHYLNLISNQKTIYKLMETAVKKYSVPQVCDLVLPDILKYAKDLFKPDVFIPKITQFFELCPIFIFSKILLRLLYLSPKERIIMINNFLRTKQNVTLKDRELLAETINWDDPDTYTWFIKYNMEWVPPKIARPFLLEIMEKRDMKSSRFKAEVKSLDSQSPTSVGSRWYPFMWANHIQLSLTGDESEPEVDIVDFISTLGHKTKPIDIGLFGLIDTFGSQWLDCFFEPKYGLITDRYFLALTLKDQLLCHGIDLGSCTFFMPKSLKLVTATIGSESSQTNPVALNIVGFNKEGKQVPIMAKVIPEKTETPKIGIIQKEIECDEPFNKFQVCMEGETCLGFKILRIYSIEYKGRFMPFLEDS